MPRVLPPNGSFSGRRDGDIVMMLGFGGAYNGSTARVIGGFEVSVEQEILDLAANEDRTAEDRAEALARFVGAAPDAASVNALAQAVRRVFGEKLNRWLDAESLIDRALEGAPAIARAELKPALVARAVALTILGADGRSAALAQISSGSLDERHAIVAEVQLSATDSLIRGGKLPQATKLYQDLAADNGLAHANARTLAVVSHNLSNALLSSNNRSTADDQVMEDSARRALSSWCTAGTWINRARAEYVLASVLAVLGRHAEAGAHARSGIKHIKDNGDEPVDEAFLRLKLAQCCAAQSDVEESLRERNLAKALRDTFPSEDLKQWFDDEIGPI
jgi:hypothetical protein